MPRINYLPCIRTVAAVIISDPARVNSSYSEALVVAQVR